MNVMEAIKTRRSIRSYKDQPVEPARLQQVLEAARLAPSANNRQDWKFIVVQDQQMREALAKACHNQEFVGQAPVVIAACSTNPTRLMASGQPAAASQTVSSIRFCRVGSLLALVIHQMYRL